MIRLFPVLAIVLMLGPVVAGLAGTLLPAFGWFAADLRRGYDGGWTR